MILPCASGRTINYMGIKLNDRIHEYSQATKVTPLLMPSIDELLAQGITKILWYDDVSQIQQIEKELRKTAHFHKRNFLHLQALLSGVLQQ